MLGFVRLCAAGGILACALTAHAGPPDTYPLSKVQRGQTGYGMTTFAGATPERFTFEVVSVVKNFLPKQDIILVKSDDPKLAVSGFWQGMSGSPLYLDDKMVCAFSYGFRFNKIALGGCTPIDYMKKDGASYRRGAAAPGQAMTRPTTASLGDWKRLTPTVDAAAALDALGPPHKSWLLSAPLPPPLPKPAPIDGDQTHDRLGAALGRRVLGAGVRPAREDLRRLQHRARPHRRHRHEQAAKAARRSS